MDRTVVKFRRLTPTAMLPLRATDGAAAYDLYSDEDVWLSAARSYVTVSTGIAIQLPPDHVGLVCSRSGLASKDGVFVLNAPGIIDEDYRGELKVILARLERNALDPKADYYTLGRGSRIAQLLVLPRPNVYTALVTDYDRTLRGNAGFGSTGVTENVC